MQVSASRLRVSYSWAGAGGELHLELSGVNVSDGQWHTAAVGRLGHWMTLTLDGGEGQRVNETLPGVRGHGLMRLSRTGLLAGADVRFPTTTTTTVNSRQQTPLVNNDFHNGIYVLIRDLLFLPVFTIDHLSVCLSVGLSVGRSRKGIVAKWPIGSGCRLGWSVGSVEE